MGIINGKEFIDRLNKLENEIWYDGKKIKVTFLIIRHLKEYSKQKARFMNCKQRMS